MFQNLIFEPKCICKMKIQYTVSIQESNINEIIKLLPRTAVFIFLFCFFMYTWILNSHSVEHCDLGSLENVVPDVCHKTQ